MSVFLWLMYLAFAVYPIVMGIVGLVIGRIAYGQFYWSYPIVLDGTPAVLICVVHIVIGLLMLFLPFMVKFGNQKLWNRLVVVSGFVLAAVIVIAFVLNDANHRHDKTMGASVRADEK